LTDVKTRRLNFCVTTVSEVVGAVGDVIGVSKMFWARVGDLFRWRREEAQGGAKAARHMELSMWED